MASEAFGTADLVLVEAGCNRASVPEHKTWAGCLFAPLKRNLNPIETVLKLSASHPQLG